MPVSEHAQAIALSDDQLDAVMRAAAPLAPADRGRFLEAVAARLRGRVIGDGNNYHGADQTDQANKFGSFHRKCERAIR
jgi:hypothetical protein